MSPDNNTFTKNTILSAARWSVVGKVFSQLFSWFCTLFVIRLLDPSDYGTVAMAAIITGLASLLNEAGLNEVIIRAKNVSAEFQQAVLGLIVSINSVLLFVILISLDSIAAHFDNPILVYVLPVLCLQFIFNAFSTLPISLLERELKLKNIALIEWSAVIVSASLSLVLAFLGFQYWALVSAAVASSFIRFAAAMWVSDASWVPRFSLKKLSDELHFAKYVILNKLFWQLGAVVDDYIIGRLLNKELLGNFAVAKNLSLMVLQKIAPVMHQVTFPVFSQDLDQQKRERLLLNGLWILSVVTWPVLLTFFFLAEPIVTILFGEKWQLAGTILKVLVIAVPVKIVNNLLGNVVSANGSPQRRALVQFLLFLFIAGFVTAGIYYDGVIGAAIGWTSAHLLLFPFLIYIYNSVLKLKAMSIVFALLDNGHSILLMAAAYYFVPIFIDTGALLTAIAQTLLASLIYTASTFVTHRSKGLALLQIKR